MIRMSLQNGKLVDLEDLQYDDIDLKEIAHSLALQCRFNGHCKTFYSVAEHSVRMSKLNLSFDCRAFLMHDAAEAFIGDVPTELKGRKTNLRDLEFKILNTISKVFDIPFESLTSWQIKVGDRIMLSREVRSLFPKMSESGKKVWLDYGVLYDEPLLEKIIPWSWEKAEKEFLKRADELNIQRYF